MIIKPLKILGKITFCSLLLSIIANNAMANPTGGNIAAGNATIATPSAQTLEINQTSNRAIINWQSFNINANETTHFQQPTNGITLNRINAAQGASQIYGTLSANGTIILINSAGVYFGPNAHVNVSSIIASTSNMSDQNFLAGKYNFDQPSSTGGAIINKGSIIAAKYGLVALIGTGVQNDGYIKAKLGNIVLASGNKFTIDLSGNQLINFSIDEGASSAGIDYQGHRLNDGVKNTGKLIADGGTILVSAATAGAILDHSINMSGVAQATSVGLQHGQIILSGGLSGAVRIAGKINVAGKHAQQSGGNITILGENITIEKTASLDASGNTGGGTILIGGNLHGGGTEQNALTTNINAGAMINASAIRSGNGGEVVVWSDQATAVQGSIFAQGGATSGNGGLIETSSHNYLAVNDSDINTSAVKGNAGIWLLDPSNLTISASSDTNVTTTSPLQPSTQTANSILNINTLLNALNNSNVIVQTGAGSGPGNGDILVNTAINWTNANSLTLSAYRNITATSTITNSGGANVILKADNTGTGIGTISFTAGNNVTLSGGSGTVTAYYNPTSFGTQDTIYTGGTTPIQYMLVNNATNLQSINSFLSGNFALGKNITLSGNFTPIGSTATPYTGKFDGQNFTIDQLSITNTTPNVNLGLFGAINAATIQNVNLSNVNISETTDNNNSIFIGSLVGLNTNGNILNSSVSNPTITINGTNFGASGTRGYYDIGGLVGAMFGGTLNDSSSIGGVITNNVITNANASNLIAFNEVGGLLGGEHNSASLQNDFSSTAINSSGNVTVSGAGATGELLVGGLIGRLDTLSTATNVYSTGTLAITNTMSVPSASGAGYVLIGGLIGITSIANSGSPTPPAVVDNAYSTSNITLHATVTNSAPGTATYLVGGLLGQANSILTNSHSSGQIHVTFASDVTALNEFLLIGGLAGDNFTTITNSYSSSPITVTGNNIGSQVSIGGFVGDNSTLFDKEITGSSANGLINVAVNNSNNGQLLIGGFAGINIYYGNPPPARLPLQNDYSASTLNVSGTNDGSLTVIGGLVAANGLDGGNAGGDIIDSYSAGYINNNVNTINAGTTYAGGFLGQTIDNTDPLSPPVTLANNFYDTGTTGFNQNQGIGNLPGAVSGVTPGCFGGGSCPNGGSADLSSQTTFTSAGWNFATVWGIINNGSYPYLLNSSPGTPQIISGTASGGAGNAIKLVTNGVVVDTVFTGPNGFFYFYEPTGTVANGSLGLIYLSGATAQGNAIFTPASDGSATGITILADQIQVGSTSTLTIANSQLSALINGLIDNNILYSASSSIVTIGTITKPNVDFLTTASTTYQLNGALNDFAGGNGNITFNGSVALTANSSVNSHNVTFANTLSGAFSLALNNSGVSTFANSVAIGSLSVTGNTTINTNSLTTTGSQNYNALVNVAIDSTLTGQTINFANGITGGTNLILLGQSGDNHFEIDGNISLANLTVTGSINGNNFLTLKSNSPETWIISTTNGGNVTGLSGGLSHLNFSNIANLVGGNVGNNFIFNNNTAITGTLDGANLAATNSLSYANYTSPLNIELANTIYAGLVLTNSLATITHYTNINSLIGNDISSITLPNKISTMTFTSYNTGYINDPVNFTRFIEFFSQSGSDKVNFISPATYNLNTGALLINGTPVTLTNFSYLNFTGNITFIGGNPIPPNPIALSNSAIAAILESGIYNYQDPFLSSMNGFNENGFDLAFWQVQQSIVCDVKHDYIYINHHRLSLHEFQCP